MPTVLLLDVSLSMLRPVINTESTENHTRYSLAIAAINTFLDYVGAHAKLEYVSLVTFSSVYDIAVPFTREFDTIKSKLPHLDEGDKTCIDTALLGVNQLVLNEWGHQTPIQIILITDGSSGVGAIGRNRIIQSLPLPTLYPVKIHILPIVSPHDPCLQHAMPLYQKIIDQATVTANSTNGTISRGSLYCPEQLSLPGILAAMTRLCDQNFQEFWCSLKCGQLESRFQLFPAPQTTSHESLTGTYQLSNQMHIIGFIDQQELGTPIAISKHLVIPHAQVPAPSPPNKDKDKENKENNGSKTPTKEGSTPEIPTTTTTTNTTTATTTTEEEQPDPSTIPNFCVLLHGALKVEGMTAIVLLGTDWWGTISAWCEASRARRSCLLLSMLQPGTTAAPWLGPLDQLGPTEEGSTPTDVFPVRAWRSYSGGGGSGSTWARPHALLADVQKVLRHARKLPDKTQNLYKELNRLRRSAISLGFSELLTCVSSALERECAALPSNAPPECAMQLAHAISALRDPRTAFDIKHTLQPLATNYSVSSMSH